MGIGPGRCGVGSERRAFPAVWIWKCLEGVNAWLRCLRLMLMPEVRDVVADAAVEGDILVSSILLLLLLYPPVSIVVACSV